jgi:hypothetical protein
VGKGDGNIPLGRTRSSRENNIEMHLQKAGWCDIIHWIKMAKRRDRWRAAVNVVMQLGVGKMENCWTS